MEKALEVVIPTFHPQASFGELLRRLSTQSLLPQAIRVVNTGREFWNVAWEKEYPLLRVEHIQAQDFDHGGTRRHAMEKSKAPVVVFMTQDAMPRDCFLLERLYEALFGEEKIGAAYARQLPRKDCFSPEKETREFNYPSVSYVRSQKDLTSYGVKTYFCSNVCAAYRRDIYEKVGGFPDQAIFNEDMIYTGHMLQAGYKVAYAPGAMVFHSHNYSPSQQFHRNFDLGVSQVQHPEVFSAFSSEGEGVRYVTQTGALLFRRRKWFSLWRLFSQSVAKYLGYLLGKSYRHLPRRFLMACTMNRAYWQRRDGENGGRKN